MLVGLVRLSQAIEFLRRSMVKGDALQFFPVRQEPARRDLADEMNWHRLADLS